MTPSSYSRKIVEFKVPGSPCGFGERGVSAEEWMEKCRSRAEMVLRDMETPMSEPVKIVCHFRISKRARPCDLDNLIKSTIDAIGAGGLFELGGGGRRSKWNTKDHWVFAVEADKRSVEKDACTLVEIWRKPESQGDSAELPEGSR